ncbi:hypothetical protein IOD16_14905 [Saccharothrix sp. 6-C]|uniref:hypothetical protein n=1 Tax=Saccharothrix sp. 6-C TaxID=2781735 RepID=UPI00191717E4|nr:hypothetical protein [Saccharothrix sp. 6-C]QQQ79569.1 hypothetical protein IOD16_14905 [Saccharothrix sp. 6-C]
MVEILGNRRHTGHQVWNRAGADRSPSGRRTGVRTEQHVWAISTRIAHTSLVPGGSPHSRSHPGATITSVAEDLGVDHESLRTWIRIEDARRTGVRHPG